MEQLEKRYEVKRLNDDKRKHQDCWFFVLDIKHDKHAREALRQYIISCSFDYPQLAKDLIRKLESTPRQV